MVGEIRLFWCARHTEWWLNNCSNCMAEQTEKDTLKAMGEWLEKNAVNLNNHFGTTLRGFVVSQYADPKQQNKWQYLIEALLRGEMPE